MSETILYDVADRVATITLNRPEKLNAILRQMQDDLIGALEEAEANDDVHVAIIRGAGRAFSAGYDVSGETRLTKPGVTGDREGLERVLRGWLRIWDLRLPVIAQVHGYCLAGGTQLASICDITFAADDTRVGTPQLPLGAGYVAAFWAWHVGPKKAKEMFFPTGEMISAAEAVEMGLFNRSIPKDDLEATVADYAAKVARTPKEILALQKVSINRTQEVQGFREAILQGADVDAIAHASTAVKTVNRYIAEHGLSNALSAFKKGELL